MGKRKQDMENPFIYYEEPDSPEYAQLDAKSREHKRNERLQEINKSQSSKALIESMRKQMYKDAGISSSSDESDQSSDSDSSDKDTSPKQKVTKINFPSQIKQSSSNTSDTETEDEVEEEQQEKHHNNNNQENFNQSKQEKETIIKKNKTKSITN